MARFVGVSRPGYELGREHITDVLDGLPEDALTLVEIPALAISSTDCRRRAAEAPSAVVPDARRRRAVRLQARALPQARDGSRGAARSQFQPRRREQHMTATRRRSRWPPSPRARRPSKLADDVVVIDVSGSTGHHRLLRDRLGVQRTAGQRHRRRGRGEDAPRPATSPHAARAPAKAAGRCWITSTSSCTSSTKTNAISMRWTGCGVTARWWRWTCRTVPRLREPAMTTRRLVMLRHGQTDFNLGSRMQGQLDTELTELGRAQAVAAAEALAKRQPLLIVSSDLRRAYDTAVALGERTGLRVQVDERLARDPPRRLAGHDARRDRRRRPRAPGWPGARTPPGHRTAGRAGSTSPRAACR